MTNLLLQQRCHNHPDREAALRCPECHYFYCRECATEHDGRMLCATCLRKMALLTDEKKKLSFNLAALVLSFVSLLSLWILFFLCAKILLAVPSQFHEGTFWK